MAKVVNEFPQTYTTSLLRRSKISQAKKCIEAIQPTPSDTKKNFHDHYFIDPTVNYFHSTPGQAYKFALNIEGSSLSTQNPKDLNSSNTINKKSILLENTKNLGSYQNNGSKLDSPKILIGGGDLGFDSGKLPSKIPSRNSKLARNGALKMILA